MVQALILSLTLLAVDGHGLGITAPATGVKFLGFSADETLAAYARRYELRGPLSALEVYDLIYVVKTDSGKIHRRFKGPTTAPAGGKVTAMLSPGSSFRTAESRRAWRKFKRKQVFTARPLTPDGKQVAQQSGQLLAKTDSGRWISIEEEGNVYRSVSGFYIAVTNDASVVLQRLGSKLSVARPCDSDARVARVCQRIRRENLARYGAN